MLIQNAIYIPALDEYLVSSHRHDFKSVTLPNGKTVSVDGGLDYIKRGFAERSDFVDWSLSDKDSLQEIIEKLLWGSYGKKGDQPVTFKPISMLDRDHLKSILDNVPVTLANSLHLYVVKWVFNHQNLG